MPLRPPPPPTVGEPSAADVVSSCRALAATLRTGDHALDDRALRLIFGLGAVTPSVRQAIGRELERAGLELRGTGARAPLVVHQGDPAAADGLRLGGGRRRGALAGAVAVVVAALLAATALGGGGDDGGVPRSARMTTPTTATATAARPVPVRETPAFAAAERAAEADAYDRALVLARPLGADAEAAISRKAGRRLAARARIALVDGDRGRARRLLLRAADFEPGPEVEAARAALRAAEGRARQRAQEQAAAAAAASAAAAQQEQEPVPDTTAAPEPVAPAATVPAG